MPILLDDLQPNKLYSKESFLPVVEKNKKKGSAIFLLSPDKEETIRIINNVYGFFKNQNLFNSYYMEKDINLIINESMIQNIDRDIVINEMSLSTYIRSTITDPREIKAKTGYDSVGQNTCILFANMDKREVAYVVVSGSTILKLHAISPVLDREITDFAVNTLKCTVSHKDIDKRYKRILKDKHDFKFIDNGIGFSSNFASFEEAVNESCLFTEGMTRINMEIAMWKAQAKLLELIISHHNDETWMNANFKSLKSRLHKIPLPGFVRKLDDSIDNLKDDLENTKATIEFMTEMAAFELKDHYDLSDVTKSYNSWIRASKCSKSLKLKLIREVKESYKETIKLYKMNLKRYELSSTVEKRTENVVALVGKTFSIFSFLTGGPLGIFKDVVMKSILPKSQKINVLSVSELEAKIAAYEKIVEELEELEDEIKTEPVNEATRLVVDRWVIENKDRIKKQYKDSYNAFKKIYDKSIYLKKYGSMIDDSSQLEKIEPDSISASLYKLRYPYNKPDKAYANKEFIKEYNSALNAAEKCITDKKYLRIVDSGFGESGDYVYLEFKRNKEEYSKIKEFIDKLKNTIRSNSVNSNSSKCHNNRIEDINQFLNKTKLKPIKSSNTYLIIAACDLYDINMITKTSSNVDGLVYVEDKSNKKVYLLCYKDNSIYIVHVPYEKDKPVKIDKEYAITKEIETKISIYEKLVKEESSIINEAKYSKPYNRKEIEIKYGKDTLDRLMKDEAHAFRADTGIELIHKEPTKDELERIMKNWYLMDSESKKKSDSKSYELYGKSNKEHYDELISLYETPLTAEQKKNLKDSDYGLPSKKAYPMPDKSHVLAAIRMFNHVDTKDEKTLANAIIKKIKEFDMEDEITVSSKNRLYNYVPDIMKEEVYIAPISEGVMYTNDIVRTNEAITFFENTFSEDATYNKALKRVLYSERIRNQKEILVHYDMIKDNSVITRTYLELDKYKSFNLFIDMTYYIESFVKHNYLKLDKGVDLFFELIDRFLKDKRIDKAGYTKKTVFIPVEGWNVEKDTDIWDYKYNINPISIFFRLIQTGQTYKINNAWKGIDFVFIGKTGYFKLDNSVIDKRYLFKFKDNIDKLVNHNIIPKDNNNSKNAIVMDIISRLENPDDVTHSGIKINNLTGSDGEISKGNLKNKIDNTQIKSDDDDTDKGLDPEKEKIRQAKEKELIDKVKDIADKSSDTDEALSKMENDEDIKKILQDIKMSSPNKIDYSPTRVARMNILTDKFVSGSYKDKTIGDILYDNQYYEAPLPETSVPIDSVNEEWKHLKGINAAKVYDVNSDIFRILYHFSECTVPVAIRDYTIEDTSTSEDSVDTWTVQCEDINGKRFTLKFDVPKIINNRFMKLRGNEKVMGIQLMNLPIIKTDLYTTQITSNYNKIFLSPVGNSTGKSFVVADRILRAISKYEGENISYNVGDNSKICRKYDLPIDYIDLASYCMDIKIDRETDTIEFLFNQDIMHEKYGNKIKDNDKLPIGVWYNKKTKTTDILYSDPGVPVSTTIASILNTDKEFNDVYSATHIATTYTYSSASIMSTDIPVAVLIGYSIGLFNMLDRAKINYEVYDKRPRYDKSSHDIIKLSDAFIVYELNYDSSMLLNGLKGCNLDCYSIKEVNSTEMWLDFLDLYGGRIKSDGFDMFYDLMFDPITKGVCKKYGLPDNYIDGLLYANILLSDNKYNKHTDITGNRFRSNEIVAGYVYKALCNSYSQYRRGLKIGRESTMTIKQSAVIDLILADNTESDYSTLSPLLEFESANAVSFKGLSGMNSDRAYGLDKRTFDKSMVNILAMSTGFAANAGINRQSVIDPNIDSVRGYINSNPSDLNITQTFCMGEALTPYGVTSDDSFRTAMTFTQTAKHGMRTAIGDPLLVTTGADEALVYLTSDNFSHKGKGKGKIKEKTDDYLVIEYEKNVMPDGSNTEVVDLRERMCKNSDGGFYQALKLETDFKVGDTVKLNDIVAIDKLAFSNTVGPTNNYAYNLGTFIKFAVVMSDEGFEDSCRSTEWLAKAMSSTVVIEQEYNFNKDTNIYYLAKKGQEVQEGEPILIFQNAFDDEDANALVRALKADNEDVVEEIGRIVLSSKVTGVVKDIKVRRCVDTDECSPTMQKVIKDYEKSVSGINKAYAKYQPDKAKTADPTYKLPATGKLKNSQDSVLITIYIAYQDDFGVSDKTVCYSALKGVSSKEVIPAGQEAFSTFRPDEKIHYIQSEIGDMKRMVGSIYKMGAINKVLVETHRAMCDIMGIKWKYYDEWEN